MQFFFPASCYLLPLRSKYSPATSPQDTPTQHSSLNDRNQFNINIKNKKPSDQGFKMFKLFFLNKMLSRHN